MNEGGTLFAASPNSGDPIVGAAGTGGRGSIQPSSLEMSNVDLSRSLTQLIVIQRGFQANSKTITTSDQMLNTLLQLKQ
jgi:flagellar hook protein FlgE